MDNNLTLRKMVNEDKIHILHMSERFNEFSHMPWRDRGKMDEKQKELALEAVHSTHSNDDIFVIEDRVQVLGFLHMTESTDFFTGEKQAYVSSIAVAKEGEGRGIAKRLMQKAEEWANEKGYKQLTLNVFANNKRAVDFYHHLNYENDVIKMVKEL